MKPTQARGAMAQFATILPALTQGQSVRRTEWEPFVRMFVLRDHLMCQCGNTSPWHHSLTWGEITAFDWQLVQVESSDEQGLQASVGPMPIPHASEQGFQNLLNESGPRHKPLLSELLLKWWNSE
jgi:hypothetical protein